MCPESSQELGSTEWSGRGGDVSYLLVHAFCRACTRPVYTCAQATRQHGLGPQRCKERSKEQMALAKVHIWWLFQLLQMTGNRDRYDTRLQAAQDLVSPAILVREHASAVAAIFVPLPVVSPSVRPHHKSPPCHHIIHPFSLVPA
jgi:hypothetical protein